MTSSDGGLAFIKDYLFALGAVVVATGLAWLLQQVLSPTNLALVYLLPVVLSAVAWGLAPALLSVLLGALTLDALFVAPYGFLSFGNFQDLVTYGVFVVLAIVTSQLAARLRVQMNLARVHERQNAALYQLSQQIGYRNDRRWILDTALKACQSFFGPEVRVFLPNAAGQVQFYADLHGFAHERTMAQWVYMQGKLAESSAFNGATFMPIRTAGENFGVLALRRVQRDRRLAAEDRSALDAFAAQIAQALEHVKFAEQAEQAHLLEASERFNVALLSSLSHDLRTLLASIVGSTTALLDDTVQLDSAARIELVSTIHTEASRLNRLVSNLIEMTRLEAGELKPQSAWNSFVEVVEAALSHVNAPAHAMQLSFPPDLPLVFFDFVLLEQVMVNLIENMIKFSPPGTPFEISACLIDNWLQVTVADRGVGIPSEELTRVFEKHYRAIGSRHVPGSGLGLLICKGIVEAHGGQILVEHRMGGGTCVLFTLPATERIRVE